VALEEAIAEALEHSVPHLPAVRHILDRKRHERGQPPPIAVSLPEDPRIRNLVIRPHRLNDYEDLHKEPTNGHEPNDNEPNT